MGIHMHLSRSLATATALAAALVAAPLHAQSDDGTTFRWSGPVSSGHFIRLHNMNGNIRIERGAGRSVEVVADRKVVRGDPKTVRFDVRMRSDGDVVICALWGDEQECTDNGTRGSYNSNNWRRGVEISVTMRVLVPDGVKTFARSTNGNVDIQGVSSEVDASSTNGNVNVRTSGGLVNATTTNGSVTASLGSLSGDQPMRFTTTNGSVTVYAPPTLSADLEMSTTNGGVITDFPVTISGRVARNSLRGTLGQGGRSIVVRSTNGDVALKRNGI
jgi:Putative adhesin